MNKKDPYGIPNTCYTLITKKDKRWKEYKEHRLKHGFDPSEMWCFSCTVCSWLLPRVEWYYKHIVCKLEVDDKDEFERIIYCLWFLSRQDEITNDACFAKLDLSDHERVNMLFYTYVECMQYLSEHFTTILQMGW